MRSLAETLSILLAVALVAGTVSIPTPRPAVAMPADERGNENQLNICYVDDLDVGSCEPDRCEPM